MKHFLEKPCSPKPLRMVWIILFALSIQKKEKDDGEKKGSKKQSLSLSQPEPVHWGLHCGVYPSASMEEHSEPRSSFALGFLGISSTLLDSLSISLPSAISQNQQDELKKSLIVQYVWQPSSKRNVPSLSWIPRPLPHTWQRDIAHDACSPETKEGQLATFTITFFHKLQPMLWWLLTRKGHPWHCSG